MEAKASPENDAYVSLDPKVSLWCFTKDKCCRAACRAQRKTGVLSEHTQHHVQTADRDGGAGTQAGGLQGSAATSAAVQDLLFWTCMVQCHRIEQRFLLAAAIREGACQEHRRHLLCGIAAQAPLNGTSRVAGPFKEAIVFMVGGGNYLEYESLSGWASRAQPPRSIVYGATELLTGEQFLQQLATLGQQT